MRLKNLGTRAPEGGNWTEKRGESSSRTLEIEIIEQCSYDMVHTDQGNEASQKRRVKPSSRRG